MEVHIITVCVVLVTVLQALPYYREVKRQFTNWRYRRAVHKAHVEKLEQDNG